MSVQRSATIETERAETNGHHIYRADVTNEYISEARYWESYYELSDIRYEWNNGQLEEIPVTDYAKYLMYLWFVDVLRDFLHVQPLARIIGFELGFRLALPTKTTIRKPDLGVVLNSNPVALGEHDKTYRGIFDICIESLSDSSQKEIERDVVTKRDEYAAAGVQEYYLLDERGLETQFYRLTQRGVYEPMPRANGVVRSQVLPGFQFRVADLYDKPVPPQMVLDPVYNGFISPLYRTERLRAEAAEAQAEQERQRAEQAETRAEVAEANAEESKARAEAYAALLREAGLLPSD
jgi:hypothetical protein